MLVKFRRLDEGQNKFVEDGIVCGVHQIAFDAMRKKCDLPQAEDQPGGYVADLYDNNGNLIDVALISGQMRVRAQRELESWI